MSNEKGAKFLYVRWAKVQPVTSAGFCVTVAKNRIFSRIALSFGSLSFLDVTFKA
jgi:hypothetical protein